MEILEPLKAIRKFKLALCIFCIIAVAFYGVIWLIDNKKTITYNIPEYNVSFDMPATWKQMNPGGDCNFKFKKLSAYFAGFIYTDGELYSLGKTREKLLPNLDEQIVNLRENMQPILPKQRVKNIDGKTITVSLYSGQKGNEEYYYYIFWIEFDGTEKFIWGLFTAPPKLAEKSLAQWDAIIDSAQITPL